MPLGNQQRASAPTIGYFEPSTKRFLEKLPQLASRRRKLVIPPDFQRTNPSNQVELFISEFQGLYLLLMNFLPDLYGFSDVMVICL
jgi:hypothetical protein